MSSEQELDEKKVQALEYALKTVPTQSMNIELRARLTIVEATLATLVNAQNPEIVSHVKEVLKHGFKDFNEYNGKLPSGPSVIEEMSAQLTFAAQKMIKLIETYPPQEEESGTAKSDQNPK